MEGVLTLILEYDLNVAGYSKLKQEYVCECKFSEIKYTFTIEVLLFFFPFFLNIHSYLKTSLQRRYHAEKTCLIISSLWMCTKRTVLVVILKL